MDILYPACVQGHIGYLSFQHFGGQIIGGEYWGAPPEIFERQTLNFLHSGGFYSSICAFSASFSGNIFFSVKEKTTFRSLKKQLLWNIMQ